METTNLVSLVVASVGIGFAAALSAPAAWGIFRKSPVSKQNDYQQGGGELYEDEDGIATKESQEQYSTIVQRAIIIATSVLALLVSIAASVLATLNPTQALVTEGWITCGVWALLVLQAVNLFFEHRPVERFNLGIHGAITSFILICAICIENGLLRSRTSAIERYIKHIVFSAIQLGAAVMLLIVFSLIPRRPMVYLNGAPVERRYTDSILSKYTFSWAGDLLKFAKHNKGLKLEDIPKLDHRVRSDPLQAYFNSLKKRSRLWKSVFFSHHIAFTQIVFIVVVLGIVQFGPQYVMYNILKLLEQRSEGASVASVAWAWVFGFGLAMIITSWLEAWLFWVIWSDLGLPVRAQLSALIFMKATRRKDVKGVGKAKERVENEVNAAIDALPVSQPTPPKGEDNVPNATKEKDDEDDGLQKTRQSTINLVGIDTKRIADFLSMSFLYPMVLMKLIVSLTFLNSMIGWKSLLSGLAVTAVVTPFNIYCSKKYNNAQGDLMKVRDQKMAVVTEALQGIRQIKFSAIERQWQAKLGEKRSQELAAQWRAFRFDTCLISIWILGPVMLSAVALAVYAVIHGELSPSVAFTTIAVFSQIESTLAVIPELTTDALDAWVSINRIDEYLNAPEKIQNTVSSEYIALEDASIAWPSDSQEEDPDRFILRNVNIRFPNKELSVVSGKTGSGKSLLLASILGEIDKMSGTIKVPQAPSIYDRYDDKATKSNWIIDSSIAFVAQIPWIENATIKDNILFGLPFDAGRYNQVVSACALKKDLDMLPDGELTDIGANGINLSGGQRWRVSFARALYSRAGILVLDDIFSAVDAHVGRHLFEEALVGPLGRGRTRILVTHHVGLCLPKTKYAVILGNGTAEHVGDVEVLQKAGVLKDEDKERQEFDLKEKEEVDLLPDVEEQNGDALQKVLTNRTERSIKIDDGELDSRGKAQPKKFTEDEKRETGSIKLRIYKEYLKTSGGFLFWIPVMLVYTSYMALVLGRSWWISIWTRSYKTESVFAQHLLFNHQSYQQVIEPDFQTQQTENLKYYLGVYVGLSIIMCIIGTLRYYLVFTGSIRASRVLFEKLTYTVLRAPLRWLDTVPVGRVLNRFTSDFNVIDSRMAYDIGFMLYMLLQLMAIIIAGLFVSAYMILFAVVLLSICVAIALRYLAGAREVKRIESNSKSPVFEQMGSALAGVGTIRAFDKSDAYIKRMFTKIDDHARAFWHVMLFNRWMGWRQNIVGAVFGILVAVVIVSQKGIDASLAGFALGFALQYTNAIVFVLRQYANMELDMNATERIVEYSTMPTEDQTGKDAPAAWPTEGRLEVDSVVAGYAPDLPPVLRGLSFSVNKNQRVGVVGRTGAGKSSLTLALFRFLEAREGSIHIDGIDISKINLHDLRSRLAIIPQDPVLFSGTVRTNLDAFDEHTDAELRDALERVHLTSGTGLTSRDELAGSGTVTPTTKDANTNIFKSLTSRISEGGLNLSQGQRQLLCLARAIVSRPKIMVLDEATSAVDMATDVLIQRSIREEFGDSTLIVIAHRLSTIADFDRILVMSEGRKLEYDSPKKLLEAGGAFKEMVEQSGERDRLIRIINGKEDNGEGSSGGSERSVGS